MAPGQPMLARLRLPPRSADAVWLIHVPSKRVDLVRVWTRHPGKPWALQTAGEQVALSDWPFSGQFPALPVVVGPEGVDVMIALETQRTAEVPVTLSSDRVYREGRLLQANLAGFLLGLGLMVAMVCGLSAWSLKRRSSVYLAILALVAWIAAAANTGYLAVWLTPDQPQFNAWSKGVLMLLVPGLFVLVIGTLLDPPGRQHAGQRTGLAAVLASLVLAQVYVWAWPVAWRPGLLVGWGGICTALCLLKYVRSARRGDRPGLVLAAALLLAPLAIAGLRAPPWMVGNVQITAPLAIVCLWTSLMLIRHAMFVRERYGREVLRRSRTDRDHDPLTALLSLRGMTRVLERHRLRQQADPGGSPLVFLILKGLDAFERESGFEATEEALLRVAASLQTTFGRSWTLARISKSRFVALSEEQHTADQANTLATRVLVEMGRSEKAHYLLAGLDLRMVVGRLDLEGLSFNETVVDLESVADAMLPGRRIANLC
jgi:GGDEF domain-containing protein